MPVVYNINKFVPNKRSMTTVNIEEVDESWALNLLNESQIEDDPITVQAQKSKKTIQQYHNYSSSTVLEADALIDELIMANNPDYEEVHNAVSNSLSAIEAQQIAFLANQQVEELPEQHDKPRPKSILARIKGFISLY